ncbi:hypothetical protein [Mycolicibacterium pallens]|uniref:Uncharacterized protein n=1 Tax=Mycolicibacterium pallens TaxID=370524 RepID=A0ABX8VL92_9MYCO|nr:hypothetical protein [Mycolicibacterium pallens]APE17780.1 hypothetical protein BOH72_23475 [Mycobacterium sp. WY10]QYL16756.1 hypothetical protein K0O64_27930 [Mycolicibacterium pallens]
MGFDVYLVSAVIAAVVAWLVSPRFQSYDPPSDIARGFWSAVAGALWPLIVVGAIQIIAVRYIARRLRPAPVEAVGLASLVALPDAGVRS